MSALARRYGGNSEPGRTLAFYDGKVVDMKYVPPGRMRFNLAAMRIVDNGHEGYVLEIGKKSDKLFFVGKGSRTSKPVTDALVRDGILTQIAILDALDNKAIGGTLPKSAHGCMLVR